MKKFKMSLRGAERRSNPAASSLNLRDCFAALAMTAFLFIIGCSGSSLVGQVLNLNESETGALQVMAIQHLHDGSPSDHNAEGNKVVTSDLGYEIEITEALINFHALKVISGGDDPSCVEGHDQEISLHATHDLLLEDLIGYVLGTQIIPKLNYCHFELQIGEEDDGHHSVKFDHSGDEEPAGEEIQDIFHLRGHWHKDSDEGEFEFVGEEPFTVSGHFKIEEDGEIIEHAFHFHDGEDVLNLLFGTNYDVVFDGVDFKTQSLEDQLHQIHENLETAIHQHAGEVHGTDDGHQDDGHEHN